uniref:Protein ninE n=1 Tax=Escherichia phage 933W TaxID=10730 RepID=NINE_BP933|nr:RecName: Full=Protein ninE [Escherichia phage 933W]CAB39293.1 unnamed protein product [Escherichia phage 933W]
MRRQQRSITDIICENCKYLPTKRGIQKFSFEQNTMMSVQGGLSSLSDSQLTCIFKYCTLQRACV